jgi:putative ABC transport system substrate-binding protein
MIDRRAFITMVGASILVVPLAAGAQQPTIPVIGFLDSSSPASLGPFVEDFRDKARHEQHA